MIAVPCRKRHRRDRVAVRANQSQYHPMDHPGQLARETPQGDREKPLGGREAGHERVHQDQFRTVHL